MVPIDGGEEMDSCLSQEHEHKLKCKQPHLGFELRSLSLFPMITAVKPCVVPRYHICLSDFIWSITPVGFGFRWKYKYTFSGENTAMHIFVATYMSTSVYNFDLKQSIQILHPPPPPPPPSPPPPHHHQSCNPRWSHIDQLWLFNNHLPSIKIICCSLQLDKRQTCSFLDVIFILLLHHLPLSTVPCRMVSARPNDPVTCPYHIFFLSFTMLSRLSYYPKTAVIIFLTSSFVMWSLYEIV